MILVPLTQACVRLGIDPKTLRRWLADARLPLQPDPQDARKKGVRLEHLHLLAQQHQRSLTPASPDLPAPEVAQSALFPAAVLALPETLEGLQAQIAALQQQITTLTQLLQKPPVPSAPSEKTPQRSVKETSPAPTPRPVAKAPVKPAHVIPRVEYGKDGRYVVICPDKGRLPFEPDSPEWFVWLRMQSSFRFMGKMGRFTAHHEVRVPRGAWRAHRHIRNQMYVQRLALTQELTIAVLEQAAATLQEHLS